MEAIMLLVDMIPKLRLVRDGILLVLEAVLDSLLVVEEAVIPSVALVVATSSNFKQNGQFGRKG